MSSMTFMLRIYFYFQTMNVCDKLDGNYVKESGIKNENSGVL